MDNDIKELFIVLLKEQAATAKSIGDLTATVDKSIASADARMKRKGRAE